MYAVSFDASYVRLHQSIDKSGEKGLLELVMATHTGMNDVAFGNSDGDFELKK